jgi:sulfane dehydrogenase subunit SoxC
MEKLPDRRRFLKNGALLAGLAVGGARAAGGETLEAQPAEIQPKDLHAYGERSRFETSIRTGSLGTWPQLTSPPDYHKDFGFRTPLQDSIGIITPAPLHYIVSHGYEPPDIDPHEHHLLIHGMVDQPLIFTLEDLRRLPSVTRIHFVECNGNSAPTGPTGTIRRGPNANAQDTHGLTSCSVWTGIPASLLLKQARVQAGAKWIIAEGAEKGKHSKSIPIEKALDDMLIAYGQNGEAIRPEQGYPLRLLVPGWEGINNVKWLRRIKVVAEPVMAMRETTKYPSLRIDGKARWFQSQLGPKSLITRPSGGQKLAGPGFYEISGLAWSGGGAISKIEVSTDGGSNWKSAEMRSPAYPKAHTRFGFAWEWDGVETVLQSRATDDQGEVQPTVVELAEFWRVEPDFFQKTDTVVGHFNAIQPWKINRDGSIQNAMTF